MVIERGLSVAQTAKGLDVHENVLRNWVLEAKVKPRHAFPGQGVMKPDLLKKRRPASHRCVSCERRHCEQDLAGAGCRRTRVSAVSSLAMCWTGNSLRRHPIASGWPTWPTSGLHKAGCVSLWCWTTETAAAH
ncbi:hypothetical protein EYS42_07440 [Aquabacterium lacunae]|uniref:Transposase n=1 Tax=Aquabacterium lacunae TaxID=2528630 RepID=A0A4Q9H2Y2_9BURK|nr:hypothetical protein EYS42_07440 [Aquabacterium lacunae]